MAESIRCATCGTEFEPSRSDARYCSGACRQQALRDRCQSDAIARIGGISAPVISFQCESGAFGQIGSASIELASLRGDPQRDSTGRLPLTLTVGGNEIWAGDVLRIARGASASIRLRAAGPESRLGEQRWTTGTWEHSSLDQFVAAAAQRAGLPCIPSDAPLDARALGSYLDILGTRSALEIMLAASRETGQEFAVRDGALVFGPQQMAEPRSIPANNVTFTGYGAPAGFAVVVRSRLLAMVGGTDRDKILSTGCVAEVPAGMPVYIVTVNDRRQPDIDALSESLAREIAAGVVHVAGDCDDPTITPGAVIRTEAAGDLLLRVTRVRHEFTTDRGLSTHFEALHLPPAPAVPALRPGVMGARSVCAWAA